MSVKTFLVCAFMLGAAAAGAQAPPVSGTFVALLGNDTVAIERYTRTGSKLEGDIITRFPGVQVVHYVADLGDARFNGMSVATRRVGADPATAPLFSMVAIFADSSAMIEVQRNGRPDTTNSGRRPYKGRVAPAVPGLPSALGIYEQILAYNSPSGRDSTTLGLLGVGLPANASMSLARRARDTVVFVSSMSPGWIEVAAIDSRGRILSMDATSTTVKTLARRATGVDFDATAKAWAATEAAQGRAGRMSPADTVRASIGNANLQIAYSRPLKRGRDVWGTVVEWNKPWRTGANAATMFTTSADLVFGNTVVPAGTYTLWSLPAPSGTKLIINTQTGQWGTMYDETKDLARLDMTYAALSAPVERFTIMIVPQSGGGVLKFAWDNREYSIPFRTK